MLHTLRVTSMPTKQYSITSPACVPAKRVFFGDHPSSMLELQDQFPVSLVGFDPNELVTFRWRHAEANWTPNSLKHGKAMVDVSKASMAELGRVITVHRPVAKLCPPWSYTTKALRTGMTRGMAPLIIVHHYSGTREQRAARFTWEKTMARRSDLRLSNGVQTHSLASPLSWSACPKLVPPQSQSTLNARDGTESVITSANPVDQAFLNAALLLRKTSRPVDSHSRALTTLTCMHNWMRGR